MDKQTGRSRGFGFVTYTTSAMVDEAMKNRPHMINGRAAQPKRAMPRDEMSGTGAQMPIMKIFIGGIKNKNITKKDLDEYFGKYGKIKDSVVMIDKATGNPRGFAFVEFDDYDPVDKIILDREHKVNGARLEVKKATPREKDLPEGAKGGPAGGARGGPGIMDRMERSDGVYGGRAGGMDRMGGGMDRMGGGMDRMGGGMGGGMDRMGGEMDRMGGGMGAFGAMGAMDRMGGMDRMSGGFGAMDRMGGGMDRMGGFGGMGGGMGGGMDRVGGGMDRMSGGMDRMGGGMDRMGG